jgi:hypothetical protein
MCFEQSNVDKVLGRTRFLRRVLYGYVHCAVEGGFDLRRHRNVARWRNLERTQPQHVSIDEVGATFPPVREFPKS